MTLALRIAGRAVILAAVAPVLFVLLWLIGLLCALVYGVILSLVFLFVCGEFLRGANPDDTFEAAGRFLP